MQQTIGVGILFSGLVSAVVAGAALMFVIFLSHRWQSLNPTMKAYAWIWNITTGVWIGVLIRYIIIWFGWFDLPLHIADIFVQIAILLTGPPLFYYLSLRIFNNPKIGQTLAFASALLGLFSAWFILQPNGIALDEFTFFTADSILNDRSLVIFALQVIIAVILLFYDFTKNLKSWRQNHTDRYLYASLYSLTLLIYVGLAGIDNAKILNDWPLVVFRSLYAASFLFAYFVMILDESRPEHFLIKTTGAELPLNKNKQP